MVKTDKNKTRKKYASADRIDDREVLHILNEEVSYYLAKNKAAKKNDFDDDLTEEQHKRLQVAIKQADEGKVVGLEEFKRRMARWLTE